MKKQTIWILTIVVILSATIALGYFFKSSKREERKNSSAVFKTLDLEKTIHIVINKDITIEGKQSSKDTNKKKKYSGLWTTKDEERNLVLPVDTQKINELLEVVTKFKIGRLTSKEPSDLSKYSLVDIKDYEKDKNEKTTSLVLKDDKSQTLLSLVITKEKPFYALFNEDKSVYSVDNSLSRFLNAEVSFWYDLRLFPKDLKEDSIKSIEVNDETGINKRSFMFTHNAKKKEKKEWKNEIDVNAKIDSTKMTEYITTLVNAKSSEFSDLILDESMYAGNITITDLQDEEYKIFLYEFSNKYYAKRRESDYSYPLTVHVKGKLFPIATYFAKKEEEKKETEEVEENTP